MMWSRIDSIAHVLYELYLVPGWVLHQICDRYDLSLGMTRNEMQIKAPAQRLCGDGFHSGLSWMVTSTGTYCEDCGNVTYPTGYVSPAAGYTSPPAT